MSTSDGARLVLVPAARQDGGLRWATFRAVDDLGVRVRAVRDS